MSIRSERVPEFISLMRTIRDVYYREMANGLQIIKETTPAFARFSEQITNPLADATTLDPGSDATVSITLADDSMTFHFGIPKGDVGPQGPKGDTGAGVEIHGADTYANIIAKTDALLGQCYICTDVPGINPPSGTPAAGDGLTPLVDNPADESDWINVGPIRGPQGPQGVEGPVGPQGPIGPTGDRGSKIWFYQDISSPPIEPGQKIGDMALIEYSADESYDGLYYELIDVGGGTATWVQRGKLDGPTGPRGSYWFSGDGVPTSIPGAKDGDMYLDTSVNDIYQMQSGSWVLIGNINPTFSGIIVMWSGSVDSIPSGWALCDGTNGTPDLRDRFIVGAGDTYGVGDTGGTADAIVVEHSHTFTGNALPEHSHSKTLSKRGNTDGNTGSYFKAGTSDTAGSINSSVDSASAGTPTGTISTEGSSGTNANLPPYYALAYIMKL